jgi:beta-lactamase superfamily II metal-dependent hydrolase
MRSIAVVLLGMFITAGVSAAQGRDGDTLDIYVIDVEGGEATLFVAPSGESMLVDTGWPGFEGRDADRIAEVAEQAGVTQIDYLVITHFHTDHMGGAAQLAERLPIRNFIDHGTTVDEGDRARAAFGVYSNLRRGGTHRVVRPGDPVPVGGMDVRIIASDGSVLTTPLAGVGAANPFCDDFEPHGADITSRFGDAEDQRSVSASIGFDRFRTVIMGDLTWNKEHPLMCPVNMIGTVDLYLVSHHGSDTSGSAALVQALQPRAAVMNNGPRKGGGPNTFRMLTTVDGLEDLWQNHYAVSVGDVNRPERFIANLQDFARADDAEAVHLGEAHWIHIAARRDGSFTVTNSRNGFSRSYGTRN